MARDTTRFRETPQEEWPEATPVESAAVRFAQGLRAEHPALADELGTTAQAPQDPRVSWFDPKGASEEAKTIFGKFQESVEGLNKDDTKSASAEMASFMTNRLDRALADLTVPDHVTGWKDRGASNVAQGLAENDQTTYEQGLRALGTAAQVAWMTQERDRQLEETQPDHSTGHFARYRREHPVGEPSIQETIELFRQELAGRDPQMALDLAALEHPASRRNPEAEWLLATPDRAEALFETFQAACEELPPGSARRISPALAKSLDTDLQYAAHHVAQDRAEWQEINKEIHEATLSVTRGLMHLRKELYDDGVEQMNRIKEKIEERLRVA